MNVILFIGKLNTGGAQRQVTILAERLSVKHHVSIITLFSGGQYWDEVKANQSLPVYSIVGDQTTSTFKRLWGLVASVWRVRRYLRNQGPLVLYSFLYLTNFIAWISSVGLHNVRLVWGIRASDLQLNLKRRLPFILCSVVSRFVPLIISNSESGLKYHKLKGFRSRQSLIIPNGIDAERFKVLPRNVRETLRSQLGIAEKERLIGLVGRLDETKDHLTFIKAASLLLQLRKDVKFVCIGGGNDTYQNYLKDICQQLGLSKNIIWTGERHDMPEIYNSLDVLVSSSITEGFSNVIGEAMACGIPCVVTDVGDSSIIVGNLGSVIKPGSPTELANKIDQILSSYELGGISPDSIRNHIMSNFSVSNMVNKTELALNDHFISVT